MSVMLICVSHDTVVSNKHEERTRHYYVNFQHCHHCRGHPPAPCRGHPPAPCHPSPTSSSSCLRRGCPLHSRHCHLSPPPPCPSPTCRRRHLVGASPSPSICVHMLWANGRGGRGRAIHIPGLFVIASEVI